MKPLSHQRPQDASSPSYKTCTKCGALLAASQFFKGKRWCKACCRSYSVAYREQHRESRLAAMKRWRLAHAAHSAQYRLEHRAERLAYGRAYVAAHRDERTAYNHQWVEANLGKNRAKARRHYWRHREEIAQRNSARMDQIVLNTRRWRQANPDKAQLYKNQHRARRMGAPSDLTENQWLSILLACCGHCRYCGEPGAQTQDHVIPLSKGGHHTAPNVAPACRSCNSRKGNRVLSEWTC